MEKSEISVNKFSPWFHTYGFHARMKIRMYGTMEGAPQFFLYFVPHFPNFFGAFHLDFSLSQ